MRPSASRRRAIRSEGSRDFVGPVVTFCHMLLDVGWCTKRSAMQSSPVNSRKMERREHRRRRFWLPVQVDGLPTGFAVSHDASDNGLLLVCSGTPEVGSTVRVTLLIPPGGNVEVTVSAIVVRVTENDEDPEGLWPYKMAVRFNEPVEKLEAYLAQLRNLADE